MPRSWLAKDMALAKDSVPIKQIVRRTGYSRGMVRHVIRGERTDVFWVRQSTIDSYLPFLDAQWSHGCRKRRRTLATSQNAGICEVHRAWVSAWATRPQTGRKSD